MSNKIKLTLGQIATPVDNSGTPLFMSALQKLRRLPLGKDAYAVAKSIRIIEAEYAIYHEALIAIVKQYGKETKPGFWEVDGAEEKPKAAAAVKALQANEFEIYLDHRITLPNVASDLTPEDVMQLEPLIAE